MKYEGRIRASPLDWVSLALVVVGALVWGLVGIGTFVAPAANWNVVNVLLSSVPTAEAVVYLLVGVAGLYELYFAYQLYAARSADVPVSKEAA